MKLLSATASNKDWELPGDTLIPLVSLLNPDTIQSVFEGQTPPPDRSILSLNRCFVRYNPGVGSVVCYDISFAESDKDGARRKAMSINTGAVKQ